MVTPSVPDTTPSSPAGSPPAEAAQLGLSPGASVDAPASAAPIGAPVAPPPPPAPYDLPAEFLVSQAPSVPQGPLSDPERQQFEYYQQREQQNSLRDQERNLADYEQQAEQHYLREGYDETTAKLAAQIHRAERQGYLARELEYRASSQAQQRVSQDMMAVAKQYNVNPSVLAGFIRREDMVRHAALVRYVGEYGKRIAALEKGRVPEQQFAGGGAGATPAGANSYTEILKSGKPLPGAAEIDRMTARYAQG